MSDSSQPEHNQGRAYRALRYRDFRLLWMAEGLSQVGTQVNRVAVAWQVYELTRNPFNLGLLGLVRFLPVIIFGIYGGVLADRGDRRKTLLITQVILLLVSVMLALLASTDVTSVIPIYILVAISGVVEGVSNPTRQAMYPTLVARADLPAAMTMGMLTFQVAGVLGPALGGFLIAWVGVPFAFAIDAVSFSVVIVAILAMHIRPEPLPITMSGFEAAKEGLVFLRQTPVLLGVMATDFVATFFGASTVLMPIFANEVLGKGPNALGILLAAPAVGAVVMSTLLSFSRLPDRGGLGVLLSVAVYGGCIAGFGASRDLVLSVLFLGAAGAADSVSMLLRSSIRQLLTPLPLLGRVSAFHRTLAVGGPQLGEFEAGVAASFMGAGPSVVMGGTLTILSAIAVGFIVPKIPAFRFSEAAREQADTVVTQADQAD